MKILSISEHLCTRVLKQGFALQKNDIDVFFMFHTQSNPCFEPSLRYMTVFQDVDHFAHRVMSFKDIDLIHVHNEPDWMGHVAKQCRPDLPVVFDAHDLFSVRINNVLPDESKCFENCDAFVYPSVGYRNHCLDLYKDFAIRDKPNIVIYSMCNSEMVVDTPLTRINAAVYEGGLTVKESDPNIPEDQKYCEYRDFNQVFRYLSDRGIPIVVFSANMDGVKTHGESGAMVLPHVNYFQLLPHLSRFDWGLVGSPIENNLQWDYAMPHKLFEYLAAGIPVITWQAAEIADFVRQHNVGVVLDSWKEIPDIYDQHEQYRENVSVVRPEFTMEREIEKLIAMYAELL